MKVKEKIMMEARRTYSRLYYLRQVRGGKMIWNSNKHIIKIAEALKGLAEKSIEEGKRLNAL